ncbi:hypothetical protein [Skermania piniformis]|uniref:Phosphotyrosine protein phosphatase I domain-containing protein n=1 Tax=Skermania pinensis TaxID=39122 RepID=A0ABX8S4B7_9ACTN|nr:hypothetical protein [Skermania piniformis]QXQ12583.1 hypothetical protein KV203_11460 [Skermania piniformis]
MRVLFVCADNVGGSAIAECVATAYAAEHRLRSLVVESAGTRAAAGLRLGPPVARVITGLGADPRRFRSRSLTAAMSAEADLILTMTEADCRDVVTLDPDAAPRTFPLLQAYRLARMTAAVSVAELHAGRLAYPAVSRPIANPAISDEQKSAEIGDLIAQALLGLLRSLAYEPYIAVPSLPNRETLLPRPAAGPAFEAAG